MKYIRKIFTQDLRDGKQIAFPKEPSNLFFKFDYSLPDPDRQISFKFKEYKINSNFFNFNNKIINTRLYQAGSESRIDGQLKHFLINELNAKIEDILIFSSSNNNEFEFEFVQKEDNSYDFYSSILKNKNHELILIEEKVNDKLVYTEKSDFKIDHFINYLQNSNLKYSETIITRFTTSLLTKPFVILTGLSGSGKTKLAQAFAMWICADKSQYKIVPVGADWTNREPLLGFPNALKENSYVKPDSGALDIIIAANRNPEKPYFLILDEMNLSHVERYFADFLSGMESGEEILLHAGDDEWNDVPATLKLPKNLFIVGTVNIDETTYMFSPKVLDRANVIEFRVTDAEMSSYLSDYKPLNMEALIARGASMDTDFVTIATNRELNSDKNEAVNDTLVHFFNELKKSGAEFGYRTASEILRFAAVANKVNPDWETNEVIDAAIMQKLLPKVHGSRNKLSKILPVLAGFCLVKPDKVKDLYLEKQQEIDFETDKNIRFRISFEKICRMYKNAIENGYASYAEA